MSKENLIGKITARPILQGSINPKNFLQGQLNWSSYELNKDYNRLANKPSIEGVVLVDDKTFKDLGAVGLTNIEIENLINLQV